MMVLYINGNQRQFEQANMSVANLIQLLGLQGKRLAIERNGEIVPRSLFTETTLASEDKLEIVGAVGGG
ncbi:MAG: sulfur carrier protein ThiS [Methylophilales bacterium]|nr:sulfur carrier protein ThiS [Methylophilales bacterium]